MVDCRKCIYFKPYSQMTDEEIAKSIEWINLVRPGARLKGYCMLYDRPITYLTGKCKGYKSRIITSRSLKEFIPGL